MCQILIQKRSEPQNSVQFTEKTLNFVQHKIPLVKDNYIYVWKIGGYIPITDTKEFHPSRAEGGPEGADRGEAHLNEVRFNSN